MSTAVETMKKFIDVMENYSSDATANGVNVLSDAVRSTSRFSTLQDAIDSFVNDTTSTAIYSDVNERLKNTCGIVVGANDDASADTGALTGANLGGSVVKTAASIVPETSDLTNLPLPNPGETTTHTYTGEDGQTFTFYVKWPSSFTSFYDMHTITSDKEAENLSDAARESLYTDASTIATYNDAAVTNAITGSQIVSGMNTVIKGLYNFWLAEGLKLAYDSYGMDFNGKTIEISFAGGGYFSRIQASTGSTDENNQTTPSDSLAININAPMYAVIDPADQNGNTLIEGGLNQCYLDRTIAHELIHAVMFGKGLLKNQIPEFFSEGSAELVHGLDDYYSNYSEDVLRLAQSYDALSAAMPLEEGTGTDDRYVSGYMFLHYLCQQNINDNTAIQIGNSAESVTFNYSGNTSVVSQYKSSDKINYATDFTGLGIVDDDLILNSSTGSLYLRNIRDKVVNVADGEGNIAAYAYMANGAGAINGKGYNKLEVIIGADNLSNTITAGSGGSSLWGGSGSTADTLIGGGGDDTFFYAAGDGADVIKSASANDTVNLVDMTLEQITSATISLTGVNLKFSDGGSLTVSGQAGNFVLDGQTYHANYFTKTWS